MTNSELISVKAPAISVDARRSAIVLSIVIMAAALRIYAISLYPLAGDEYGSLAEARAVGLNWNSIIYSGLMHFWIGLGSSEFWLRLPAAIFGTATVLVLFKTGTKLFGWRTGMVAALLAATSPFSIYHSQEVRFYSLFILTSASLMFATISYLEDRRTPRTAAAVGVAGIALLMSHFLGVLALFAQLSASAFAARSRWSRRTLALILFGTPAVLSALLLIPLVRQGLWSLYRIYGNAASSAEPVTTSVSIVNFVKAAFAGFVFIFGYHVYPLRWFLVAAGVGLSSFLLLAGARKIWRETRWGVLPFTYLFALLWIYLVLDVVGGRVAAGVSPRHVAFVWPVFLLLVAAGLTSFKKPVLLVLLAAALTVNAASIWSGWQKEWTYGTATDYRRAAEQASLWIQKDTAIIHDGRSTDEINFYFPRSVPFISSWSYLGNQDLSELLRYQRLIFVTDDWEPWRREGFDRLMGRLSESYSVVDGHVDYPFFEYALERKTIAAAPGYGVRPQTNQVLQPVRFYGIEFQDLGLPVHVKVKDVPLTVIGAYGLPDSEGRREVNLPLSAAIKTRRVVFLSDTVGGREPQPDQAIAEILVQTRSGQTLTLPIRSGIETTSWDKRCDAAAPCQTALQWRKRIAVANQNGYEGALRDFSAGLHGVDLDLSEPREIVGLTIRYTANSGRLYVWGIALPNN